MVFLNVMSDTVSFYSAAQVRDNVETLEFVMNRAAPDVVPSGFQIRLKGILQPPLEHLQEQFVTNPHFKPYKLFQEVDGTITKVLDDNDPLVMQLKNMKSPFENGKSVLSVVLEVWQEYQDNLWGMKQLLDPNGQVATVKAMTDALVTQLKATEEKLEGFKNLKHTYDTLQQQHSDCVNKYDQLAKSESVLDAENAALRKELQYYKERYHSARGRNEQEKKARKEKAKTTEVAMCNMNVSITKGGVQNVSYGK